MGGGDIDIDIDKATLKNIDIDIDKEISENVDIDIDKGIIKIMVQNPIIFACFQPNLVFFSSDLLMEYRIFISIVNISANLKNIDTDIGID